MILIEGWRHKFFVKQQLQQKDREREPSPGDNTHVLSMTAGVKRKYNQDVSKSVMPSINIKPYLGSDNGLKINTLKDDNYSVISDLLINNENNLNLGGNGSNDSVKVIKRQK